MVKIKVDEQFDKELQLMQEVVKSSTYRTVEAEVTKLLESQRPSWSRLLMAIDVSVVDSFGQAVSKGFKTSLGPSEAKDQPVEDVENSVWHQEIRNWVKDNVALKIRHIEETSRDDVIASVREVVKSGIAENEGIFQIADKISQVYGGFKGNRSEVIARTEVISASNAGSRGAALQTGLNLMHTWVTASDGRERPWHRAANGQTQPMGEPFIVSGEKLMFPGDSTRGASASNVIQCRCVEVYKVVEKEGGE